jgi:hypothetical protein
MSAKSTIGLLGKIMVSSTAMILSDREILKMAVRKIRITRKSEPFTKEEEEGRNWFI